MKCYDENTLVHINFCSAAETAAALSDHKTVRFFHGWKTLNFTPILAQIDIIHILFRKVSHNCDAIDLIF